MRHFLRAHLLMLSLPCFMFGCDSANDPPAVEPGQGTEPVDGDECEESHESRVDGWCVPHGSEVCDDEGHFCRPGLTCCAGGCAPPGAECCYDGTFCHPGYSCNGDGSCELIATEENTVYLTCAQVNQCFASCFASVQGPAVASCLSGCERDSSLAALEEFKRYFSCDQDCRARTQSRESHLQCFELNCAQLQFDCIGERISPG